LTSIPWREGRSATWDVNDTNTVTGSLHYKWQLLQSAPPLRQSRSTAQRNQIRLNSANSPVLPVSIRDNGPINFVGLEFISDLSHRISRVTDDPRETSCLFQRISVAIQRFNGVIVSNYFCQTDKNTASLSKDIYKV